MASTEPFVDPQRLIAPPDEYVGEEVPGIKFRDSKGRQAEVPAGVLLCTRALLAGCPRTG